MTREEAIEILWRYDVYFEPHPAEKVMHAIDMAIESLSADEEKENGTFVNRDNWNFNCNDSNRTLVEPKWIPCSERLPKAEDMYQPPEQRYLCQLEAYGEKKFCVLSRLKGAVSPFWDWYGVAVHDSEVIAWMPLPTPYGERR